MKEVIKLNLMFNITEYTIVYLFKTFIIWEFTNPFNWIINLPSYDGVIRFGILFCILIWQGMQIQFIKDYLNTKNK